MSHFNLIFKIYIVTGYNFVSGMVFFTENYSYSITNL
jgi:hypothetical protein